jgi:hypothetical protein
MLAADLEANKTAAWPSGPPRRVVAALAFSNSEPSALAKGKMGEPYV